MATTTCAGAYPWTSARQPFGLLHGGVSVVLAETLGSIGAFYASPEGHRGVGLDINANHLRAATSGWVTGTARPVHIGRTTQVWAIEMVNDAGELTCVSRITMWRCWRRGGAPLVAFGAFPAFSHGCAMRAGDATNAAGGPCAVALVGDHALFRGWRGF